MAPDPRERKPPLFRVFSADPDRHRPLDGDYVQVSPVRLHRPGPWRSGFVVALALGCAWLSLAGLLAVAVAQGVVTKLIVTVIVVVPIGLAYWLTARVLSVGVYANDALLRQNRVLSAVEVDWSAIADVRRVPGPVRVLGIGPRREGERLVVVLRDGDELATTITTHSPDFLLRAEAFDQACLAVEHWWQAAR